MNFDPIFDLVAHMREHPGDDYAFPGITQKLNYQLQAEVLSRSIQSFMQNVASVDESTGTKRKIQAFSGSTDLPQLTKDVFNVTQAVPEFDTLWQRSFRGVQLRRGQLEWEIADVSSGMLFELIPEGGKAKIYSFTGNKALVSIDTYGAGTGVTWKMIEGRKLYQFIDQMMQVRARLNDLWADIHYALLAAASLGTLVTYQGVVGDPVIDRDIATMNKGYTDIGDLVKDKGYGEVANVEMLLYVNPKLKSRLAQAKRVTQAEMVTGRAVGTASSIGSPVVEFNVTPLFTWNSNIPANKGVLVLPGNKIQNAMYIQELSLSQRDIETLSEVRTYWTMFGAAVGDAEQTAELSFS